jgi:hypothetical protein
MKTDNEILAELENETRLQVPKTVAAMRRTGRTDRETLPGVSAAFVAAELEAERRGLLAPFEVRRLA